MRRAALLLLVACEATDAPEGAFDSAALWEGLSETPDDVDQDGADAVDDCDDLDAGTHPGADEVCGDGLDNDCAGGVDDGCPGVDGDAAEATCDDGVDDDDDGATDCDDDDCTASPACAVCLRDFTAACGTRFSSEGGPALHLDGASRVGGYAAGGGGKGELVLAFAPIVPTTFTLTVDPEDGIGPLGGLDVALYPMAGGCDPALATSKVDDGGKGKAEAFTFDAGPDDTWYVAVENAGGTEDGWTLRVTCSE